MQEEHYHIIVVGGGIVGAASAYKLQQRYPSLRIAVLEKEDHLAGHQTGNNSGVIHSGIYYKPGSYKAKNCVEGRRELVAFAQEHNIPHDVCGKIILAVEEWELPLLDKIYQRGLENDIEGIRMVEPEEIKELEPHVKGLKAIHVPCTGIIDFRAATEKMAELVEMINPDSKVYTGTEVERVQRYGTQTIVVTNKGNFRADRMVYCAGLQSDRMAKKDGVSLDMKVVGFRGDYYDLTEKGLHKVKNLIYPVPNPAFPFLGVHFTRMTTGVTECGPNAVFTFKREGYGKMSFNLKDTLDALTYRGTWRLFFKHWKFGIDEYRRAFSQKLFLKTLRRLIPSLEMDDITPGRAGVRAMALDPYGDMIDDFKIEYKENSIHVLNAPSPAATASLAIGTEVCNMAASHFRLSEKKGRTGSIIKSRQDMLGLFGKKKIKGSELAPLYVNTIYEVIENGFPEIAGYINEEKEFHKSPNLSEVENEWFLYIVYAGNMVNLDDYFKKAEAETLSRLIAEEVVKKMGKDPEIIDGVLYDYEVFLRSLLGQPKNLIKAMSLAIFHKYDLNRYQKEHFQKLNAPNPVVMKELNEMVEFFLWNWEDYLAKYKVVV